MKLYFETELLLPIPPKDVWRILTDFPHWKDWTNRLLPEIEGSLREGARLKVCSSIDFPSLLRFGHQVRGKIEKVVPGKELSWVGDLYGIRGRHGFLLEPKRHESTRLVHWEECESALAPLIKGLGIWSALERSFEIFNRNMLNHVNSRIAFHRREVTVDGEELSYIEEGTGKPLLLLHGYPENALAWRHQIQELKRSYRVIALDLPGWGKSTKSLDWDYRYSMEVERINQFLMIIGIEKLDVIAHDYGGYLALGWASKYASKVRSLTLINTRAHLSFKICWKIVFKLSLSVLPRTPGFRQLVFKLPVGEIHRISLRNELRSGVFDHKSLNSYLRHLDKQEGRKWLFNFFANYYSFRPLGKEQFKQAKCLWPCLILWGDKDNYLCQNIATDLAKSLPNAELKFFRAGHYLMEEKASEVNQEIENFLMKIEN